MTRQENRKTKRQKHIDRRTGRQGLQGNMKTGVFKFRNIDIRRQKYWKTRRQEDRKSGIQKDIEELSKKYQMNPAKEKYGKNM
jgi:hypothetical protein